MPDADASGSIEIAAPPERVWALLSNPDTYRDVIAETVKVSLKSGTTFTRGSVFRGTNRNGWRRWSTSCRVTDARPDRFAFDVSSYGIPVARWQYDIAAAGEGCRVTESMWDRRPGWFKKPAQFATGMPDRIGANRRNIEATLQRLKQRAETG